MKKALVFGSGRMGTAVGMDLASQGLYVTFVDRSWGSVDRARNKVPGSDGMLAPEYVAPETVEGHDVVVGCAGYSLNAQLARACVAAKVSMCDLGGNNDVVRLQLAMDEEARRVGITIIPDCGLAPGMANLLAMRALDLLGGTAESVRMYVGGLPENPDNPPVNYRCNWSITGLVNEYLEPSVVVRGGVIKEVESLTEAELVAIPESGVFEAFHTSGGISTLPDTMSGLCPDIAYKTLRHPGHANGFLSLKRLGFFSPNNKTAVEKVLEESLRSDGLADVVHLMVTARGPEKSITFHLTDRADLNGGVSAMARTTGFSAAIVAGMLARGEVTTKGVVPGERCVPLNAYVEELRKRGFRITQTEEPSY